MVHVYNSFQIAKTGKLKKYKVMEECKFESLPPSVSVAFWHNDRGS